MEESTYETFEDELGTPLQEKPPAKPVRLIHRADMQATRKVKEEPPSPQNAPKPALREISRTMSIRRALSIQNLGQMESPWAGITLNRCLFVAVTILLISSGIQRLNEALKALRAEEDGKRVQEDGGRVEESLALRHAALKQDGTPPQPASSLWHSLFQWVLDDDDEDEEEESVTGMKSARGRDRERDTPGSAGRKREKRTEKRGRGREEEEEEEEEEGGVGKRGREKRETLKQLAEDVRPRKKQKKNALQEKQERSEVTEVTEVTE